MHTNEKFYRSLVRVIAFEDDSVWLHIIGWMPRVSILRLTSSIPRTLAVGQRFFAKTNLGTDVPDELELRDFEFPDD